MEVPLGVLHTFRSRCSPELRPLVKGVRSNMVSYRGALEPEDVRALAETMRDSWLVPKFRCTLNLTSAGIAALAKAFNRIELLRLPGCKLHGQRVKVLADALRENPYPVALHLNNNQLDDEDVKVLMEALPGGHSLDLTENRVGDEGARVLARGMSRLIALGMVGNPISEEGAKALLMHASLTGIRLELPPKFKVLEGVMRSLHGLLRLYTLDEGPFAGWVRADGDHSMAWGVVRFIH